MNRIPLKITYKGSLFNAISYLIVLGSLFVAFCSLNKASLGSVCVILSLALIVLNLTNRNFITWLPFATVCAFTTLLLELSGQAAVRGFNAPIMHTLKFIYLMFSVALSIGFNRLSYSQKKTVLNGILVSILITVCISLYNVLFVDKYAIRYFETRGFTTVVDFSQFYAICIMFCVLFLGIISFRRQAKIWGKLVLGCLVLVCIALSLYVTGVIITVFGTLLAFAIFKYGQSKSKAAMWAIVAVIVLLVIFLFSNQISDWIYSVTEPLNWIVRDRLRSVADTLLRTDHNLVYSYDRRDELAEYSLTTFRKHPLFGIGYRDYGYGVIGCHQEWQDMLGVFGIVGTALFVVMMIFLTRITTRNIMNRVDKQAFYLALLLFFFLGFLNPCLSLPILSVVFIVAPNVSIIFGQNIGQSLNE